MKLELSTLTALAVLALSSPLCAETDAAVFDRCLASYTAPDTSPDCVDLRNTYLSSIRDCMVTLRDAAERSRAATGTRSGHAYRARYLVCAAEARKDFIAANR